MRDQITATTDYLLIILIYVNTHRNLGGFFPMSNFQEEFNECLY